MRMIVICCAIALGLIASPGAALLGQERPPADVPLMIRAGKAVLAKIQGRQVKLGWKGAAASAHLEKAKLVGAAVGLPVEHLVVGTRCKPDPSVCTIPGADDYMVVGEPKVDGDSAVVLVDVWRETGHEILPIMYIGYRVTLTRINGAWKVAEVEAYVMT